MLYLTLAAKFLKGAWQYVVMAILAGLLVASHLQTTHWKDEAQVCAAGRAEDRANYQAASDKAKADNMATVVATEHKLQTVVDDTKKDYDAKLQAANSTVAAYVERMRQTRFTPTISSTGGPSVPPVAFPATSIDGPGETTIVPVSDLNVCAEAVTKAVKWQDFWNNTVTAYNLETSSN